MTMTFVLSDKYTVKWSKHKDSLACNQDNMFERDYVYTHVSLQQWAGTMEKKQLSVWV
jgi:hypothetical protein